MAWQALLDFWFGALDADGFAAPETRERWFAPNAQFDTQCRDLFGPLLDGVRDGRLDPWLHAPKSRLAYIILCDQVPRNIHRGSAAAFAFDGPALTAAREGISRGDDRALGFDERAFFYMPFEHSENVLDQHTAVGLFQCLHDSAPKPRRELSGNNLRFAQQHRDIILRFGRFPHRNAVLGRAASAEEAAYAASGDGFGQNAEP